MPFLSELLSIGGKSLAEYLFLFLIGYYVFSNESAIDKAERYKWFFLCIGLLTAILNVYLFIWFDTQYPILNTAAKFVAEWFMILALLGIGKGKLDFSGKVLNYMSQKSFAFYILHFIWVVLFQYLLADICGSTFIMYILPVILAYAATFLCCEICARIPFISFLMGTKTIKHK